MNRLTKTILLVVSMLFVYGIVVYFCIQDSNKCDEHVTLMDGTEYDCREVSSFSNGMSAIRMCNGSDITLPTWRIKQITEIK